MVQLLSFGPPSIFPKPSLPLSLHFVSGSGIHCVRVWCDWLCLFLVGGLLPYARDCCQEVHFCNSCIPIPDLSNPQVLFKNSIASNSRLCVCVCVCMHMHLVMSIFCIPMDYSLPGASVCGIFQAKILEWVAISFSRGLSRLRDQSCASGISCIGRCILYHCAT